MPPEAPMPNAKLPAGLYLIATPIGNLGDMTARSREALQRLDWLLCEDTRVTRKLLTAYAIASPPPLSSYHDHNAGAMEPRILQALAEGKAVGLVSDSGTPLVSDPGARLVPVVSAAGYPVTALPGASAVIMALCLSGLSTSRFFFAGFLPQKSSGRKKDLATLSPIPATLVIYESPHRLADSLKDMLAVLGNRQAAICRELTKLHEEVRRGTLADLHAHYEQAEAPRGEIVVVIAPPAPAEKEAASIDDIDPLLIEALETMRVRDAAAFVAEQTGLARRDLYARAVELHKLNPQ